MRDSIIVLGLVVIIVGVTLLFFEPVPHNRIYWLVLIGIGSLTAYIGYRLPEQMFLSPEPADQTTETDQTEGSPKFYCRYCGSENKKDAVFCEGCGRKIGRT